MINIKNNIKIKKLIAILFALITILSISSSAPNEIYAYTPTGWYASNRNTSVTQSSANPKNYSNLNVPYITITYNGVKQAAGYVEENAVIRRLKANEKNTVKPKNSSERFRVAVWLNGQRVSNFKKAGEYVCYVYKYGTTKSICNFRHWVKPQTPTLSSFSLSIKGTKTYKGSFNVKEPNSFALQTLKQRLYYQFQISTDPNFSTYSTKTFGAIIPKNYDNYPVDISKTQTNGRTIPLKGKVYARVRSCTESKNDSRAIYSNWSKAVCINFK